jgi:hypothetical protein
MERDVAAGGLGEPPGFPVLADKGSHVASLCGLKRSALHTTVKAIFILDKLRLVRYRSFTAEHLVMNIDELLRTMLAVQQLDQQSQGQRLLAPAGWLPGGQLVACTPAGKKAYCKQLAKNRGTNTRNNGPGPATQSAAVSKDKQDGKACTKSANSSNETNSCSGLASDGGCKQKAPSHSDTQKSTSPSGIQKAASHSETQKATGSTLNMATPPAASKGKTKLNTSPVKSVNTKKI